MEEIKFTRIRDVKLPTRGTPQSAGIDFYIPKFDESFIRDLLEKNSHKPFRYSDLTFDENNKVENFVILPNEDILIPSGIKANVIKNHALIAYNKSGVCTKKNLICGACVVDETIIYTNKGKFQVKNLTKQFKTKNNIKLLSYNENGNKVEENEFDGFRKTKKCKTLKLSFDNKTELICSEDHLILTNYGWKEAISLSINDEILSLNL